MLFLILSACSPSSTESTTEKPEEPAAQPTVNNLPTPPTYTLRKESTRIAEKVACADINNDGTDEHIYIHQGSLFWGENQDTLQGAYQTSYRDKDKTGKERLLFATGYGKGARDATAQLYALDSSGPTKLWERDGERNQITSISTQGDRMFISTFTEGTMVSGGWIQDGEFEALSTLKMAMSQAPLNDSVVIGRLYGDQPRSFGDLRIQTGEQEIFLPVFRGIKNLIVHDINQDNQLDILVSDGWHYQYASQAKGRIRAFFGPDFKDVRTLANFDQDYTVSHIEPHRNGRDYLVHAARHVYLLERTDYGFKNTEISKILETGSAVFCYDKEKTAVLISGQPSQLIHLEPTP